MPNQEIMREWVAALRSGDYLQGRGRLKTDNQYCCLGVLCDIAVKHGVLPQPIVHETPGTDGVHTIALYGAGAILMPPGVVNKWADIPSALDYFKLNGLHSRDLASMNDNGKSFAEIADLIEESWIDLPADVQIPDSPAAIPTETVTASASS